MDNLGNLPEDFREKGPKIIIILDNASSSLVIIDNSQDVSHVMKHGKKMIGEIHDKRNEMILDAILREAARDGFQTSLSFPNKSKWLKAKVPIWFGTGGLLGR